MSNVVIRNATRCDLEEIVRIYNATIPSRMVTADTEPVSVESKLDWFDDHNEKSRPLWVATDGTDENQICGWLSFQSFYGRPAYMGTAEVSIYVDEQHRHQGVGRSLLEKAIQSAPAMGIKTLVGFIFGHNTPSLQLFERFGFEVWGHLPQVAELDGLERDLVIVGRRVTPAQ